MVTQLAAVLDKGVASKLKVKASLLERALRRDGWSGKTVTLQDAQRWAEDVSKAPGAVQALLRRKHSQRETRLLVGGGVGGILSMPERLIARAARDAGRSQQITRRDAQRWRRDRSTAPAWVQTMLAANDQAVLERARQRSKAPDAPTLDHHEDSWPLAS